MGKPKAAPKKGAMMMKGPMMKPAGGRKTPSRRNCKGK